MSLPPPPSMEVGPAEAPAGSKPRRPWRAKFADAFRGLKLGIRGHSSFFVHFFFTALALAAALALGCDEFWQWGLLIGCIGFVLTAELFNSAVETLYHSLDEPSKSRAKPCLDIAAGAVLLASATAVIVGALVFSSRIATMWFAE